MKLCLIIFSALSLFLLSCSPSTEELYSKAYKLEDNNKYKEAIEVYNKIIRRNSKLQDAFYGKGYCYLQDSNYVKALHFFEFVLSMKGANNGTGIIIEINPNIPFASEEDKHQVALNELYYQIGVTKYNMDSLPASYKLFRYCIDRNYETPICYAWQGLIWLKADSVQKACSFFEKAKSLGHNDADRLIRLYCLNKPEK